MVAEALAPFHATEGEVLGRGVAERRNGDGLTTTKAALHRVPGKRGVRVGADHALIDRMRRWLTNWISTNSRRAPLLPRRPGRPGALISDVQPLTGGASSLTFTGLVTGGPAEGERIVLKVAPPGLEPIRNRDVARQARLMRAARGRPRRARAHGLLRGRRRAARSVTVPRDEHRPWRVPRAHPHAGSGRHAPGDPGARLRRRVDARRAAQGRPRHHRTRGREALHARGRDQAMDACSLPSTSG